ncbi:MAG: hypothetical protein JRJ08_00345 [Deltaproteobacteria bacterium]|nr:hypothetical protein [Deltaproteobacteria bacterium]
MTSQKTSPIRRIFKWVIRLAVIGLILVIALFLALPPLLSSDFGRKKVAAYLAENLQKPVSIDKLSFSWRKGLGVSGLNINNKDQSPFLKLRDFRLIISWPALAARKIAIQTLNINGIELIIIRDKSGRTNISDLLEPSEKEAPSKEEAEFPPKAFPALFLEAQLKDGHFTFIDQRLDTTTRIKDLTADLSIRSLTEPIKFLLKGSIVLNNKTPEPIELTGTARLSSEGKIDLQKARGNLKMKASFGHLSALFDLTKFNTPEEATGASLSCFFDLNKLAQLGAGIVGLPPELSIKGKLRTSLEARGNFQSRISINGKTRLTDLSLRGGPFKATPFEQPQIDFLQNISLNFTDNLIEVKVVELKSKFVTLSLSGTINDFQNNPDFKLRLSGDGNLYEIARVLEKPISLTSDLKVNGIMKLSLSVTGNQETLNIKGIINTKGLQIEAPFLGGHPFQEKSLEINPDILINIPQTMLTLTALNIRGETLNADSKGTLDGEGNIDLKVTLFTKFSNLKKQLQGVLPSSFPGEGRVSSDLTLQGNLKKALTINGTHTVKGAKVILPPSSSNKKSASSPITLSPLQFKLVHDLIYNADQGKLAVNKLKANSEFLNLEGSGTVSNISTQPFIKSQVKLLLDLEEARKFLGDLLPEELTAKGEGKLSFTSKGYLKSPEETPLMSTWNGNGSFSLGLIEYPDLGSLRNLQSTQLSLSKGILRFTLECLLNNGPSRFQGTLDFSKKKPVMKINMEGTEVQISQDLKILGYIVPVLIVSPSGRLSGKGNFSIQASWNGTDWDKEVSRTITGKGTLSLNDGILQSKDVLAQILKTFGKPETLQFEQILTGFRLGDGRIYNDNIQVNGKDLEFGLQGWTSLVYVPSRKGNPMEYTVTGDFLKKSLGKDGQKVLSLLSGGESTIPISITGTVQKPKVSMKMPKIEDLFRGIIRDR